MNACEETLTTLVDERDGRACADRVQRLKAHAQSCPACARAIAGWSAALPKLRELTDAPLSDTSLRRMENGLMAAMAGPAPRAISRRAWRPVGIALAASVALAIGIATWARPHGSAHLAQVQSYWGQITREGKALRKDDALLPGDVVMVPADGEASLGVGRGVDARLLGPARLSVEGDRLHPRLRLDAGRIFVRAEKRLAGETLRVQTIHGHVEVRGTSFVVGYDGDRSFVRVDEGEVAAFRAGVVEPVPVRAGETLWLAPPLAAPAAPEEAEPAAPSAPSPSCEGSVLAARKAMRADRPQRALAVIEGALVTPDGASRCRDELGYLRAEALRQAGANDQAIAAFKALDGPNATRAMRQNALYAAGQLEARRASWAQAGRLFERAFAVHPDGALAEESLAAVLDAKAHTGQDAKPAARRYLKHFPNGRAAARAQTVLGLMATPVR